MRLAEILYRIGQSYGNLIQVAEGISFPAIVGVNAPLSILSATNLRNVSLALTKFEMVR
jgi:predicted nuclease with RNAse H fold